MSALRPAGSTRAWRQLRALVLDRDGRRCQLPADQGAGLCGAYATHVDHVLPRVAGGGDNPANLRAACARHNLARGAGQRRPRRPQLGGWSW